MAGGERRSVAYVNIFDRCIRRGERARAGLHRLSRLARGIVRVELMMLMLAGIAGGLAGTLWGGLVTAPWLAGRSTSASPPAGWRGESAARVVAGAAIYAACGAAAGFLFWLGWGLIALIDAPWHRVGLLFGALLWSASALPLLAALALRRIEPPGVALALAVEALVASASVGLLCAWVWHRAT
jgi:hypothetical protein